MDMSLEEALIQVKALTSKIQELESQNAQLTAENARLRARTVAKVHNTI
jgi:regulator of replication initiation timing